MCLDKYHIDAYVCIHIIPYRNILYNVYIMYTWLHIVGSPCLEADATHII